MLNTEGYQDVSEKDKKTYPSVTAIVVGVLNTTLTAVILMVFIFVFLYKTLPSVAAIVVGRVDFRRKQKGRGRPFFFQKKGDLFLVFAINRLGQCVRTKKIKIHGKKKSKIHNKTKNP